MYKNTAAAFLNGLVLCLSQSSAVLRHVLVQSYDALQHQKDAVFPLSWFVTDSLIVWMKQMRKTVTMILQVGATSCYILNVSSS